MMTEEVGLDFDTPKEATAFRWWLSARTGYLLNQDGTALSLPEGVNYDQTSLNRWRDRFDECYDIEAKGLTVKEPTVKNQKQTYRLRPCEVCGQPIRTGMLQDTDTKRAVAILWCPNPTCQLVTPYVEHEFRELTAEKKVHCEMCGAAQTPSRMRAYACHSSSGPAVVYNCDDHCQPAKEE